MTDKKNVKELISIIVQAENKCKDEHIAAIKNSLSNGAKHYGSKDFKKDYREYIAEAICDAGYCKTDDLIAEIAGLTGKCEALQKDNENLTRTLEEGAEVVEEAKKETATRIYQKLYDLCTGENPFGCYDLRMRDVLEWANEDGVEVE